MENKPNKVDLGILVASCDHYSDLWEPFFILWDKYWPDCPFLIYLMSNTKVYRDIQPLFASANNWSDEFKIALDQFPHEYLLYFQDDYFLSQRVNTKEIKLLLDVIQNEHPAYLRVYPHPGNREGTNFDNNNLLQILKKGSPFITSLQVSFWNVNALKTLLVSGESIWDFEINSINRTHVIEKSFLSVKRQDHLKSGKRNYPINYFCTAIRKGKWRKDAIQFCKDEGISLSITRPIENYWDELKKKIYDKIPIKYQEKVINMFW